LKLNLLKSSEDWSLAKRIRRIQLHNVHRKTAKLTIFAGFEMPESYTGVIPEHLAVRNGVGIFDISHMGRVSINGTDSERFLDYIITNDVSITSPNEASYSVMCNPAGGVLDDFVFYRLEKESFLVVYNANNRKKDFDWLAKNSKNFDVKIEDISDQTVMFAVQGPKAELVLQEIASTDLERIRRFGCDNSFLAGVKVFISRTGYTGEDGFEIFVWNASLTRPDEAVKLWNKILESGRSLGLSPCGLAARDTLRLEAGMCLYGNDIDETTTPLEARLGFVVKFKKERFIGKEALLQQKEAGVKRKRVGISMIDKGIPRPRFDILNEADTKIGFITSGTFSPILKSGIGMGYVETTQANKGNIVKVKIRKKLVKGRIASFPFYDTEKYGYKRKLEKLST
jgi:aminomethyltransferase